MNSDWNKLELLYQTRSFMMHYIRQATKESVIREWDKKLADNQKEIDKFLPKSWQSCT